MSNLVLSAIGTDQPGLVDSLTETLSGYAVNVADSRMINLAGQFAIVMLIELPDEQIDRLSSKLPAAARQIGLSVMIGRPGEPAPRPGVPMHVHIYSMDQPGLVHRIAHLLHTLGINIEEMDTLLEHGAHTGTPLFTMDMVITVPDSVALPEVRRQLGDLCVELNCDVEISPG